MTSGIDRAKRPTQTGIGLPFLEACIGRAAFNKLTRRVMPAIERASSSSSQLRPLRELFPKSTRRRIALRKAA